MKGLYREGDKVVTRLTGQRGIVKKVVPLARADFDRLHIKTGRRIIFVDSDMVITDNYTGMLTLPQVIELAQRRADVERCTFVVVFCSTTGYNIMTIEAAKKANREIKHTCTPVPHPANR